MRISSRCILIEDGNVLLIYRERDKEKYYVFPGGGVHDGQLTLLRKSVVENRYKY